MLFVLIIQALQALLARPRSGKRSWWLVAYVFVILALSTIGVGGNAKFIEMTYIDDRNYPGGPNAYTFDFYGTPINVMDFAACVLLNSIDDNQPYN